MFPLSDLCETRVWREAYQEGVNNGLKEGFKEGFTAGFREGFTKGFEEGRVLARQQIIGRLQSSGQTLKQISQLLGITVVEVRRLAKKK